MPAFAQTPEVHPQVHRAQREQWFLRGRMLPRQPAAARLRRAHAQKLALRAAKPAAAPNSSSGWTSLGPAPLASDASGVGQQDYNWVSGRATAVAIDPSDPTANTVYLGGAYGGVWKSTKATQPPGNVVWTPLIDNQATLAVRRYRHPARRHWPHLGWHRRSQQFSRFLLRSRHPALSRCRQHLESDFY